MSLDLKQSAAGRLNVSSALCTHEVRRGRVHSWATLASRGAVSNGECVSIQYVTDVVTDNHILQYVISVLLIMFDSVNNALKRTMID